jgi:hypothetical protein
MHCVGKHLLIMCPGILFITASLGAAAAAPALLAPTQTTPIHLQQRLQAPLLQRHQLLLLLEHWQIHPTHPLLLLLLLVQDRPGPQANQCRCCYSLLLQMLMKTEAAPDHLLQTWH